MGLYDDAGGYPAGPSANALVCMQIERYRAASDAALRGYATEMRTYAHSLVERGFKNWGPISEIAISERLADGLELLVGTPTGDSRNAIIAAACGYQSLPRPQAGDWPV